MSFARVPITDVFCSQISVGGQSASGLYETVFDLVEHSNVCDKLTEVLKARHGNIQYVYAKDTAEKIKYTLWTEPDARTVRHGTGYVTFDYVAEAKGSLMGHVDVYLTDVSINNITTERQTVGVVTIGKAKVHVKSDLTLQ